MFNEEDARQTAEGMGMQIRYFYILTKGESWTADSTPEISALQAAHLAHHRALAEEGTLVVNGPFLDSFAESGDQRGAGALKADSLAEARKIIQKDPMVKAGRLRATVHAWMVAKDVLP